MYIAFQSTWIFVIIVRYLIKVFFIIIGLDSVCVSEPASGSLIPSWPLSASLKSNFLKTRSPRLSPHKAIHPISRYTLPVSNCPLLCHHTFGPRTLFFMLPFICMKPLLWFWLFKGRSQLDVNQRKVKLHRKLCECKEVGRVLGDCPSLGLFSLQPGKVFLRQGLIPLFTPTMTVDPPIASLYSHLYL